MVHGGLPPRQATNLRVRGSNPFGRASLFNNLQRFPEIAKTAKATRGQQFATGGRLVAVCHGAEARAISFVQPLQGLPGLITVVSIEI